MKLGKYQSKSEYRTRSGLYQASATAGGASGFTRRSRLRCGSSGFGSSWLARSQGCGNGYTTSRNDPCPIRQRCPHHSAGQGSRGVVAVAMGCPQRQDDAGRRANATAATAASTATATVALAEAEFLQIQRFASRRLSLQESLQPHRRPVDTGQRRPAGCGRHRPNRV